MTNDFVTQGQAYSYDPRRDGFIHTAEAQVRWRAGIDIERSRKDKQRVTEWSSGINEIGNVATFRFNPNNERICSPCSGNMVKCGNCRSLTDFENVLTRFAYSAGFERDDIEITRADFAVDCFDDDSASYFQKMCDLLIAAFIVRHDVGNKHQHWSETTVTRAPKSNKATHGQITIERYNKAIQQPAHGALWRLELRYSKDKKHPDREQPATVSEMLEALIEELSVLPKFYTAAQKQLNEALLTQFAALQTGSVDHVKVNQFLYQNDDRIFSRAQVKQFFAGLGVEATKCRNHADNYSKRYAHMYISKAQFEAFTEYLSFSINKWVTNDPFFNDILSKAAEPKDE